MTVGVAVAEDLLVGAVRGRSCEVAGAGYLLWLGWSVLRQPAVPTAAAEYADVCQVRVMLKGAGISGLNPKALLLYFALFPQFIDSADGWPVTAQTGLLSLLHLTACAVVYLAVGVLARRVLKTRPSAARVVTRISGAMVIAIGAFLLVERLVSRGTRRPPPNTETKQTRVGGRPLALA
ncbi:LysE family translocator [Streptomyces sp. NPDC059411]|uniref:LysE family translocator n=1 Tax=Streptomyces sp. NPDC059411 TaxID=3346825 RepID=UPI0036B238FD